MFKKLRTLFFRLRETEVDISEIENSGEIMTSYEFDQLENLKSNKKDLENQINDLLCQ